MFCGSTWKSFSYGLYWRSGFCVETSGNTVKMITGTSLTLNQGRLQKHLEAMSTVHRNRRQTLALLQFLQSFSLILMSIDLHRFPYLNFSINSCTDWPKPSKVDLVKLRFCTSSFPLLRKDYFIRKYENSCMVCMPWCWIRSRLS